MTPEQWAQLTPQQQAQHIATYGPPPPHYTTGLPVAVAPPPAKSRKVLWIALGAVGLLVAIGLVNGGGRGARDGLAAGLSATATPQPLVAAPPAASVPSFVAAPPAVPAAPTITAAPAATTVTLPEVKGRNGGIVYDELTALGLTRLELASRDRDDTVVILPQNWTAVKIEPAAGTKVRTDQVVVVTMTKR